MPVVSLFDVSGNMVRDWAIHGHTCYCFDIEQIEQVEQYDNGGKIIYIQADLNENSELSYILFKLNPYILFGFPDCTDLAVSGARAFESKYVENTQFQHEAVELCRVVELLGELAICPWMLENPVSLLATLWRKPDYYFHPNEYGGYLPNDDIHPTWPDYIPPRDAYTKQTGVWTGNGFKFPPMLPVPIMEYHLSDTPYSIAYLKLGGKSAKTKQIRSETPRGFARAVFLANRALVQDIRLQRSLIYGTGNYRTGSPK